MPNNQWQDRWQQLKAQFELDSAVVLLVESLYIATTRDNEAQVAQYLHTSPATNTLTLSCLTATLWTAQAAASA